MSIVASGQLPCHASGPVLPLSPHLAALALPWQPGPDAGSLHTQIASCLGKLVCKKKLKRGPANYLGPRNGSQEVLENNEDILSAVKGMDL